MDNLLVNIRDQRFLLFEQLSIEDFFRNSKFGEYSKEIVDTLLNEAQKMAIEVILPTRKVGDKEGCKFKDGKVVVPECYHEAYKKFSEAGWASACADPETGGQGMPMTVHKACCELFGAANYPFCLYHWAYEGAANLIYYYGTETQKKKYMNKLYSGQWGGTQCMTESNAGTDVAAIRTTAKRLSNGTYSISGTKIFISEGDHDLTENIIHTVLGRIEGDPPGTKGLSMFLVPKIRVNEDGTLGEPNDVKTIRIEEKMGFHGNGTCVLSFGEEGNCTGELLDVEQNGMRVMFQFINEARIYAGIHGLSQASGAYQHAVKYAKERIQSPPVSRPRKPYLMSVPIIHHPDVRRMLMWMKSYVEGIRGLNYFTAFCMDMAFISENDDKKDKYKALVELLVPICKAFSSDTAMEVCSTAIDVHGGYGYCSEFPVEQYLRDTKIACIYEGTNSIQAFDLVWRKLDRNKGRSIKDLFELIWKTIMAVREIAELSASSLYLEEAYRAAVALTEKLKNWKEGPDYIITVLYAKPSLSILGDLIVGWLLVEGGRIAFEKLRGIYKEAGIELSEAQQKEMAKENIEVAFYQGKCASATFFAANVLPTVKARCESIMLGDRTPLEVSEESFM